MISLDHPKLSSYIHLHNVDQTTLNNSTTRIIVLGSNSFQNNMYDEWFTFQLMPYGDGNTEDGCHPSEAQALDDYLRNKTTAAEAARAITHQITLEDDPYDNLHRLWGLLMDALLQLPAEHIEPLLALLKAIQELPEPDFSALAWANRPHKKLWEGLPGWGHMWCDMNQASAWRDAAAAAKGAERDTLRCEHVRKREIEARMVANGIGGFTIDEGYEAVSDALESSNAVLDFEVPAAEKWFDFCSQQFFRGAEVGEESWGLKRYNRLGPGDPLRDLWGEPLNGMMNQDRLNLWSERLRQLRQSA